jgi:hypothetical protein
MMIGVAATVAGITTGHEPVTIAGILILVAGWYRAAGLAIRRPRRRSRRPLDG